MEQVPREACLWRFGVYEIDLSAGELRKSGHKIGLQEQPFQVLVLLLAQAGQLVTREELQKRLWPADTFVDFDLGLNTAIKKIRAALGDSADNPKFVETLPRKGYRFICPVEKVTSVAPGPAVSGNTTSSQSSLEAKEGTTRLFGSAHYRIWLAAGALALLVVMAVSFYRFRHGGQKTGIQPVPSVDVLKLEEQGTLNAKAYQAYLKGEDLLQAYDAPQMNENAIEAFRQAIQYDPNYALAYAGLSQAYWKQYQATHDDKFSAQAQVACNKSLELDARRPEAHICLGRIHFGIGQYERAVADFSEAIKIDPRSTLAYRGRAWAFQRLNKESEAEKDFLQASQLDPHDWHVYTSLAQLYLTQGRYDEAIRLYQSARKIRPDNSELLFSLGAAYIFKTGQYDQAIAVLSEAVKLNPSSLAYQNLAIALFDMRRFPEAITNFQEAVKISPGEYQAHGNLARAYFWSANQRVLAQEQYERAIAMAQQRLTVNAKDPDAYLMLAVYYAMLKKDDPHYYLDRALQLRPEHGETAFWASVVHLQSGNPERALAMLRRARMLGYSAPEINAAPELDSLRDDPEFRHIMSSRSTPITLSPKPESDRRTQ